MLILRWILCCKNLSLQSVMHCKWTMAIILSASLLFLLPEVNLLQELHNTFYCLALSTCCCGGINCSKAGQSFERRSPGIRAVFNVRTVDNISIMIEMHWCRF